MPTIPVRAPTPIGTPTREIGPVLFVGSDVDAEGFSTDPEFGPTNMARRIALSVLLAWVGLGFGFLGGMFAANNATLGLVIGLVAGGGIGFLGWRGMGKTKRTGRCVYVGVEGVTVIEVNGDSRVATTQIYRDDLVVSTSATDVIINGSYNYSIETIRFGETSGTFALALVGTFVKPAAPGVHVLAVRAAIAASGAKRARAAQAHLAQGGQIAFPILSAGNRFGATGEAIVLDPRGMSYVKSQAAAPVPVARGLAFRDGKLQLAHLGGAALATIDRERVGNLDMLHALVGVA